jgi:hypothetical protein
MLSGLTKRFRLRAAITVAVLYAVCVLAPHAALAFVHGPSALHCLNDQHGMAAHHDHGGTAHRHADGSVHHHGDHGSNQNHSDSDGKDHPANCCGLFCMSALAADDGFSIAAPLPVSSGFATPPVYAAGRAPDGLYRPPIV